MKEKHLEDYLPRLKTDDIVGATQEARRKSMKFLNDQGIAAMALLISEAIAETIEHPERLAESMR